tara:strand:+ start:74 stop:187 length:114 start_codon:yes stop_codon:yes gene_type:complete
MEMLITLAKYAASARKGENCTLRLITAKWNNKIRGIK